MQMKVMEKTCKCTFVSFFFFFLFVFILLFLFSKGHLLLFFYREIQNTFSKSQKINWEVICGKVLVSLPLTLSPRTLFCQVLYF